MRKPKVAYWNNIPSPYMVDRFNALVKRGEFEFEAWFSTRTESDRSWAVDESSWGFPYRYLTGIGSGQARIELPGGVLSRNRPDVLVSLYSSPSFVLGTTLARVGGTRVAYWTEVTFDSWVERARWKEWLKTWLFQRVDGVLTPGADGQRFALRYGARSERIHVVPHAIDVAHFSNGADAARRNRSAVRTKIGVTGCTYTYVGRLWEHGKGLDHLIEAFGLVMNGLGVPATLLLVGDGTDEASLRRRVERLGLAERVVFSGFVAGPELPAYLAASDVFVYPSLGDPYGLAIDEAMAASLPVVATSAIGELDLRVVDGDNGWVVPPADTAALAKAMMRLGLDANAQMQMGGRSRAKVDGRTPDRWASDFEEAVRSILTS